MSIVMFPTYADSIWDAMVQPGKSYTLRQESLQDQRAAVAPGAESSLSRLLTLLEQNGEDDYGILGPTQHGFLTACRIIDGAERQMVYSIPGSPCVDSQGGIRVTWRLGGKEVRLICPSAPEQKPYIYEESETHNQATHDVTPETLAQKLSWLVSGGVTL